MELTDGQKVMAGYWEGIDPNDNEIETNKAVTIDASAYTEPVVVEPTDNYDAMKKVTVTLSNLSAKLYAWKNSTNVIYTKVAEPTTSDKALIGAATGLSEGTITTVASGAASITVSATVYERYSDGDVVVA